jgi:hypothetical protein
MRTPTVLALCFVLAHAIGIAVLFWPSWWLGLLALLCWLFAAVGAGEPEPTTSPRHRDVRAAERTALGQILMYREGWIIERPMLAIGLVALLSMLAAATVVALTPFEETPLMIARTCAWAPAVILAAGFILAQMVNMWIVSVPILFFWLLSVILIALSGDWETTLRIVAGGVAAIASLFCLDLLRGARRGLERARKPSAASE